MKLGLINSAWAQAGRETAYGLNQTKRIGFDSVDIFADPLDIEETEIKAIRKNCESLELPILSVACVALGLIDFNPSVRRFHLERCERYLEMVRALGGRNLLLVLCEYVWQREVIPPREQWAFGVEALKTLGESARSKGLEIVMELEPFRESLLNDIPNMRRFLDEVDHPAVLANLDISHLALAHQSAESLEMLRGRIGHIHISDCDGKVHGDLPPGRGVVNFDPYLAKIAEMGLGDQDVVMSIELEYSPEPDKIEQWVEEAYASTKSLMARHGLK